MLHERTELVSSDTQRGPCAYLGIIAITYSGRIVEVDQIGELSACIGVIGPTRQLRVRTDRNAIFSVRIGGALSRTGYAIADLSGQNATQHRPQLSGGVVKAA